MGLDHARITRLDTGEPFDVLFNPAEYTLNKENAIAQAAVLGLGSPLLQFVNGNVRTLDMELYFDTYEAHVHAGTKPRTDVRALTSAVTGLMAINPETHVPPVVEFAWGELTFTGVLVRANERFTMFLESGVPVRAQVQVMFQEWISGEQEAKEVKRQTADYSRRHETGQDETLSAIASAIYGDPAKWRPIAIANELEDPRRLRPGLVLDVPPLPYRDPVSGEVHA